MTKTGVYLRSLIASWAGYGANIVVMFFLSPFVVHSLGNARYGLWSLLMAVTGYLGLVEIGVRVSTGRYVNYHLGRGENEQVSHVVNTSLAFYCLASLLVLAAALTVGQFFGAIFPRITISDPSQVRAILLLMALNVWLGLWSATFSQLLYANNRFDLLNAILVLALGVRAGGTVLVLRAGGGLVELAWVLVASSATSFVLLVAAARWKGVRVRYGWRWANLACFRRIFGFGAWSFVGTMLARIIDYANAAVIGILLGASEIAYFAIGYMLLDNSRELLSYVVRVMTPDLQKSAGAEAAMGERMVRATSATMFVAVPLLVGLIALGGEFIRCWMGSGYEKSATVLVLVAVAQFGNAANMSCGTILNAMGFVRLLAAMAALEAGLNLGLSVVLVKYFGMGIVGVAIGMMAPSLAMTGVVLLVVACRRTGIALGRYLGATFVRWGAATAVLLPATLLISRAIGEHGWRGFWIKAALMLAMYVPLGVGLVLGVRRTREMFGKGGRSQPQATDDGAQDAKRETAEERGALSVER